MAENAKQDKVRTCCFCGRRFVAAGGMSAACEECVVPRPQDTKSASLSRTAHIATEPQQTDESSRKTAASAAKGPKSSGGGTWMTPTESSAGGEPNKLDLPAKTRWRSPPFAVRFPENDAREQPPSPEPPSRPTWMMMLLRSASVVAVLAVLIVGGVLISHDGLAQSLRWPWKSSPAGPPVALREIGSAPPIGASKAEREAAFRQRQKEAKRQQQRATAMPHHR